jgi:hypothetical protein
MAAKKKYRKKIPQATEAQVLIQSRRRGAAPSVQTLHGLDHDKSPELADQFDKFCQEDNRLTI